MAAVLTAACAACLLRAGIQPVLAAGQTRQVTDTYGRTITVPETVRRIVCIPCPAYERIFMLGGKNKICEVRSDMKTRYPLALLTNPDLARCPSALTDLNPKARINVEEFIKSDPDVVMYFYVPSAIRKLAEADIPVFAIWSGKQAATMEEFIENEKFKVRSIAELLGNGAPERADRWCAFYDRTVRRIRERTTDIPDKDRPKVYIGNSWGADPLSTWGGTAQTFMIRLCGGISVMTGITGARFPRVSLEQVIAWAPDVILIDNTGNQPEKVISEIQGNLDWQAVNAVTSGKIYRMPIGVFHLDKCSSQPVFLLWLAKLLMPDRFADIDPVYELQFYCKTFYQYHLSSRDARRALEGWERSF